MRSDGARRRGWQSSRHSGRPVIRVLFPSLAIMLAGCRDQGRGQEGWDAPPEPITIAVADSVAGGLRLDSVRFVPAQAIQVSAIVEPDRDHRQAVTAVASGESRIVALAPTRQVQPHDSIGSLLLVHRPDTNLVLHAPARGLWRPGRHLGAVVWPGDTVGIVQLQGWLVAVGQVSDAGTAPARSGDSALVTLDGIPRRRYRASVNSAVTDGFGSTEIRLHFQADNDTSGLSRIASVELFPSESLLVVPEGGLGHSLYGPAVFLPQGNGRYRVQLVRVDPHSRLGTVVHRGLDRTTLVAAGDLSPLQAAAAESLAARRAQPR